MSERDPWEADLDPWETDAGKGESTGRRTRKSGVEILRDMLPTAQGALDFAGQTVGTAGGIAAGAPGGPAGMAVGGGLGSVAGKRVARDVGSMFGLEGSEQYPRTTESAIDAAAGAVGPVASAASRVGSRVVTGLKRSDAQEAFTRKAVEELSTLRRKGVTRGLSEAEKTQIGKQASDEAIEVAKERAVSRSAGDTLRRGMPGAALGSLVEPVTGALLGAGASDAVLKWAVPRLLESRFGDAFAKWALQKVGTRNTDGLATSLLAVAAEQKLSREEQRAMDALAAELQSERKSAPERPKAARDTRGRFTGPKRAMDHSGLEELFGGEQ
ncbi:MAG: hypothetical protein ACKVP3_11115 [Hyphomicrobiaceae bacterium]